MDSPEQLEYGLSYIMQVFSSRRLTQTQLAADSGVTQSTISKLFNRGQGQEPTFELLRKLCKGLGLNVDDVLHESDQTPDELLGYLATPLTGLPEVEDRERQKVVSGIKRLVASCEFVNPSFDLYWPGDFTHPSKNPDHTPSQVYRKDRGLASSYDFVILVCLSPSYGVGQENEIATQAGLPAIRLLGDTVSRMLRGSFLQAIDIPLTGT